MEKGEKLYAVQGKSINLTFRIPGGEMSPFPILNFTVAASEAEAIEKVFSEQSGVLAEYGKKVERLKSEGKLEEEIRNPFGELGLFPPSKPVSKEDWRAQEVKVPGYKIILEKK